MQNFNVTWFCSKVEPVADVYVLVSIEDLILNPINPHTIPEPHEALGDDNPASVGGCFGFGAGK